MTEIRLKTTDDYINRQVAIEALRYVQHKLTLADETNGMGTVEWDKNIIYFSEAERVLMNLPFIQSQINYEDVINRQAAIDALMEKDKKLRNINWHDKPYAEDECRGIDEALSIISNLSSAQPEAVVRCKDCVFYASAKGYSFGVCKYFSRDADDTDYCNSGERRIYETD